MNESHSILQRMRELAVQSANDTNTDSDRAEMQKEVDQLAQALSDISEDTEFNTQNLLDGSFEGTFQIGANENQNLSVEIGNMSATELKAGFTASAEGSTTEELTAGETYSVVSFTETDIANATDGVEVEDAKFGLQNSDGEFVAVSSDGETFTDLDSAVSDISNAEIATGNDTIDFGAGSSVKNGTVSVTANATAGVDATATGGIHIGSQEDADKAITTIQSAIDTVSAERSKLGAVQNRLDHTINNLGTSAENLTAAESRIRDVDYDLAVA